MCVQRISLTKFLLLVVQLAIVGALGWWYLQERQPPSYGPAYREYAYVTNGKSNPVSVIDRRTYQPAKTIAVGLEPTGDAANSKKNEIYVVNTGSNNLSEIDPESKHVVVPTSGRGGPDFIDVA